MALISENNLIDHNIYQVGHHMFESQFYYGLLPLNLSPKKPLEILIETSVLLGSFVTGQYK
mgnify:CR=1 FL=1